MNPLASAAALLLLAQGDSGEADRLAQLDRACSRVQQVYPLLMLAAMAEGGMNCGDPDSGEFIDCDANDTPDQRERQAKRLEIRQTQEAAFKQASEACDAWADDRGSLDRQLAVTSTYLAAREVGTVLPAEVMD